MLISHRYKFIFLKTEKTASTSLLRTLRRIILETDQLHNADWAVGKKLAQEYGSLNGLSFSGNGGYVSRRFNAWKGIHSHGKAADVQKFLGPELFKNYTVITSERNPWDRQVSLFTHRRTKHPSRNIRDFRASMPSTSYNFLHYNRLDNWKIYSIDDRPVADRVIQYENLNSDYCQVLSDFGLDPEKWPLPHSRAIERFDGPGYRDYYDDATRDLVGRWYAKEIAHFGYEF